MLNLDDILMASTQSISESYFQLPVAGAGDAVYRERVYCYELYHQMRLRWPQECQYSLGGEVDKAGHPLVRGNGLDAVKPDFLIHVPGDMGGNFAVIEVKPVTVSIQGISKDIATLSAFKKHAQYERSLILIYGAGGLDAVTKAVVDLLLKVDGDIEIWVHADVGVAAERIPAA